MTETKWNIPTPDGHTIYGVKNTVPGNSKAIFIVHGLTGHMYEYAPKRAADFFPSLGYDVFRFNLYDGEKDARTLVDCTLQTHAEDLNTVLKAHGGNYEKVFLIGHSYGGPTVMLANPPKITAVSLWDPSFDLAALDTEYPKTYNGALDCFTVNWGTTFLIGKAMHEHALTLDETACINLAKAFKAPIQVVFAGDGYYVKQPANYHSFGNPQNRSDTVPGTSHCFYEGQSCDELLKFTHSWIGKW